MSRALLTCGHVEEGMVNRLRPQDAEVYCFICMCWVERDGSNGLCMEDLPDWDTEETR